VDTIVEKTEKTETTETIVEEKKEEVPLTEQQKKDLRKKRN